MKKQNGFTLPELIISALLGVIVIAATLSIYVSTVVSGTDAVQSARLNHDLESIMVLMAYDIKRAGYWAGADSGTDAVDNPFTADTTDIQILSGGSCIRYSYDADEDGVVDSNEYYGFTLDGSIAKMRSSNSDTTTAQCPSTGWGSLNESALVEITALNFNGDDSKCINMDSDPPQSWSTPCSDVDAAEFATGDRVIEQRVINITLTGRLNDDAAVERTLQETVMVRNNRVYEAP